ncbi:uncharacterized protein [Henckelia pumila]|uniref:uncharacterized protein n=1 Tax=Henckelia pumila TaxID=405737 RepID=UPI003C6DE728
MEEIEKVILCTFFLCGIPDFVLIDNGASHSFISTHFVKRHKLPYIALDVVLSVSTLTGQSALAKRLVLDCPLEFEGNVLIANLLILAMEDFDCILGIDMLTTYRDSVDCYQRLVQFHPVGDYSWFFYESGEEGYLIYAVDLSIEGVGIGDLPVVNEFLDVFPDEITGFPLVREVEFGIIELVSGTSPILRVPYRLALSEMRELK